MFREKRYWKRQFDIVMTTNEQFAIRCAEMEKERVQLTTICAALNQDNEKLRTLAHQKVNELIDALDKITELEAKVERMVNDGY